MRQHTLRAKERRRLLQQQGSRSGSRPEHGQPEGHEDLPQNATSAFQIPSYFPYGNLRVLVSPFMPFNTATKTTDIIMCNSQNLGALIVKDEPHVKAWDEPQYNIHNVGIEESYGFGVLNEGQV